MLEGQVDEKTLGQGCSDILEEELKVLSCETEARKSENAVKNLRENFNFLLPCTTTTYHDLYHAVYHHSTTFALLHKTYFD